MRNIEGTVFGQSRSQHAEDISLFVRGEKAIIVTMLIQSLTQDHIMRFSLQQLKDLHAAVGKAIEWLENKKRED